MAQKVKIDGSFPAQTTIDTLLCSYHGLIWASPLELSTHGTATAANLFRVYKPLVGSSNGPRVRSRSSLMSGLQRWMAKALKARQERWNGLLELREFGFGL